MSRRDIYVMVYFPNLKKAYCFDRGYNLLWDGEDKIEYWGPVAMGDITQVWREWRINDKEPEWARKEREVYNYSSIAIWTNYYD